MRTLRWLIVLLARRPALSSEGPVDYSYEESGKAAEVNMELKLGSETNCCWQMENSRERLA